MSENNSIPLTKPAGGKPGWLKVKLPTGENYRNVRATVDTKGLHTICQSGNCPNMGECWGAGTATFMILGNICTRSCGFCAVATGRPKAVDLKEPERVAEAVSLMKVKHCVITSVDRDDLKDGGASIWVETINTIRKKCPGVTLETLIGDFQGDAELVAKIAEVRPEIVSHNLETVRRLTKQVLRNWILNFLNLILGVIILVLKLIKDCLIW